jgi:mRNA-degrading endonuclease RelE of RelBE toxin-antitoxin system
MICFETITHFRERLQALMDYKRSVYSGAETEIKSAFKGVSIEQIRQNRDMILMQDDSIAIKLRLPDHRQRLSKKDGYRLIYLVSMIEERVAFLDIYPKRGPLQQLDIPDEELLRLLSLYVQEGNNDQLQFFDIST